jgi:hypothetical protein
VSGFDRLCWEGLAVCLTGSPFLVMLSSVRFAFDGAGRWEKVGLTSEKKKSVMGDVIIAFHRGTSPWSYSTNPIHA